MWLERKNGLGMFNHEGHSYTYISYEYPLKQYLNNGFIG